MIEVKNIDKQYKNIKALDKLSFKIKENESVGIIGNNGSGKTTLINILCNLISYDFGEIFLFNEKLNYKNHEYKSNTGFILNDPYYLEELNVVDYLSFVAKFHSVHNKMDSIKNRIADLIRLLEIKEKEKPIADLSSGNKRKITIAASLIHNPDLLIYDEPFLNLDIKTLEIVKRLLLQLKGKKTILITSHHLDLVIDLCDRYLIIDEGVLIKDIDKNSYNSIEKLKEDVKNQIMKSNINSDKFNWLN